MPDSAPTTNPFDWIPFYEELADKLTEYPSRQDELITFVDDLHKAGLTVTPMLDRDSSGQRFRLTEIDPFTFFGTFNRGVRRETRIAILDAAKRQFGIGAPLPTDFAGIPIVNNQKSWFFAYHDDRGPGDIERLWKVFLLALGPDPLENPEFGAAFDDALEVRNTNVNLTMGLFWIRPRRFLSVDRHMRARLKVNLPSKGLTFGFYRDLVESVRSQLGDDLARASHEAWEKDTGGTQPVPPVVPPPPDLDYWLVGAYWHGEDAPDQTQRFLDENIWENGYEDRYLDLVRSMKVGDKIAIKSTTTQKNALPFDARGHTVSLMLIKATGTIVSNPGDGRRVEVEWDDPQPPPRSWYFYTLRSAVWRIRKDDHYAQQLIRFVFEGGEQDYEYFTTRWWGDLGKGEPRLPVDIVAEPYSAADLQAEGVFLNDEEVAVLLRRLRAKKNLILRGAPGVGKTFVAKRLAFALMEAKDEARLTMVQFHPSYSYEDFVRGYRPTSQAGQFELVDGPFWHICKAAEADPDHEYALVIDEINRSNVSQVLGELMMLLEADKRAKHYEVRPLYRRSDDEKLFIPPNLYLIGTMNIADRSLALVDYALRRRFAYFTLEPRYSHPIFRKWLTGHGMTQELCSMIVERMTALNKLIAEDKRLGDAYRVGHSFFCPSGKDFSSLDEGWYREIVETEIKPLLEEYWYDEPAKVQDAMKLL